MSQPTPKLLTCYFKREEEVLCRTLDHYHEGVYIFEIVTFLDASFLEASALQETKIAICTYLKQLRQHVARLMYFSHICMNFIIPWENLMNQPHVPICVSSYEIPCILVLIQADSEVFPIC